MKESIYNMNEKDLSKCVLNEEYQNLLNDIQKEIENVNQKVRMCLKHLHDEHLNKVNESLCTAIYEMNDVKEYYGMD